MFSVEFKLKARVAWSRHSGFPSGPPRPVKPTADPCLPNRPICSGTIHPTELCALGAGVGDPMLGSQLQWEQPPLPPTNHEFRLKPVTLQALGRILVEMPGKGHGS